MLRLIYIGMVEEPTGNLINYPPPEGAVLSLPLEGDKNALPPEEARRAVPNQVLYLIRNLSPFAQLRAPAFLDT